MRASRRPIALALLLGTALVVAPSALSASPAGRAGPALGALDQAWQAVGRLLGWFGGLWVDEAGSPDPNGKQGLAPGTRPAVGRPAPGAHPENGLGTDPNGNPPPAAPAPTRP